MRSWIEGRGAEVDSPAVSSMPPILLSATKPMHHSTKPSYDLRAIQSAKKSLTAMVGLPKLAAFVSSHGGWMLSNLAKILPAELSRITAGGAPIEATAKPAAVPARQLIRLGATPPATPTTPPKPPVHKFIPAPKPSAPPAKPRAAGVRPDGSFNIVEAEARTRQIFGSIPNMVSNANEASRWASLESVFRVNGFAPPWTGKVSKVDAQIAKLNGPLFARRAKLIATLFQS